MLRSHFFTLILFSALVSTFFGTLTRETAKDAVRLGGVMMVSMVGISLIVAYLMYFFPLG